MAAARDISNAEGWHPLDNAARVFAALASQRTTTVYRVAATLREPVDIEALQASLDALMPRFPYFGVRLRRGLFWHYLAEIPGAPRVQQERHAPCRRMSIGEDGPWQFRVLVFGRRVSLECSHVLTDGAGALAFLGAVLGEYLSRKGVRVPDDTNLMRPGETPDPEEEEDAYRRFYNPGIPRLPPAARALRIRGVALAPDDLRVITGVAPLSPLRAMARERGVTLTELLASVLLAAVADMAHRARRPIVVMTPVNLRTMFPSRTMRNFFLSVRASIDPSLGSYEFEEILHEVHHSVQGQVTAKSISRQIRRHVGAERNWWIRHIPLIVKQPLKRWLYRRRWGARYTTALSNVGAATLPPALDAHIERFEAIPNPSEVHGVGCAIVGHREDLYITFASLLASASVERAFFRRLRRMGVCARIETNRTGA
jgi:hypothetical protein